MLSKIPIKIAKWYGNFFLKLVFSFFIVISFNGSGFAELPEMTMGIIPLDTSQDLNILHYLRGGIFFCLIALCFKAIKSYSKLAVIQSIWLFCTGILGVFAYNTTNYIGIPDFSYLSVELFCLLGLYIYASAEYLRRIILNHNQSSVLDNIIYVIAFLCIGFLTILNINNSILASNILLYCWAGVVVGGSIVAIYYIVDKSADIDFNLLGWIPTQIGFMIAIGIGSTSGTLGIITSMTAWSSVIIAHIFLAVLTFFQFKNTPNKTMLHKKTLDTHSDINSVDSVSLIIDKAAFRINQKTQKIILNEVCAKMLHISGRKTEFSIDAFKGLVAYEYQYVIDKIISEKITNPEIIKFHVCSQKGFIQPVQFKNNYLDNTTQDDLSDILFLYQEMTDIISVSSVSDNNHKTIINKHDISEKITPNFDDTNKNNSVNNQITERRKISDLMYFINKTVDEIQKDSQTIGDYILLLSQIRYYDDWLAVLGVSQTQILVQSVTEMLESALSSFENLIIKNFNGDIIGIFCHAHNSEAEIERLKIIINKQFEAPMTVGEYNIFVNFNHGVAKISVTECQLYDDKNNLINLVTNMIDTSKRIINMYHNVPNNEFKNLSLPLGSNIIQLSSDLRYAPERDQIHAYFAPIIDIRKGFTIGFDISPVWRHPDFGIITGNLLDYISERCHIENTLNRLVIAKSIEGIMKFYNLQKLPIVNIRLSRKLLLGIRIDEEIKILCDTLKISPSLFRLEFSSDCLGDNPKWLANILTDLKMMGISTVLNGFGSAKGQLSALANLAFDRVIIDSGFADEIIHNERKFFALKSLVSMLRNMSIKADIKDVTSQEAFKLLFNAGISNISGSAIGDPMPIERAISLLAKNKKEAV